MKKEEKLKEALEEIASITQGPLKEAAKEFLRISDEIEKIRQDNQEVVTYDIGQRFLHKPTGDEYILAVVRLSEVMLINLNNGRRWSVGAQIRFLHHISEKEFNEVTDNQIKDFELIK